MAGQYHRCHGHELGQTLGDGEGQGSLACCSPWGCKESDTTGQSKQQQQPQCTRLCAFGSCLCLQISGHPAWFPISLCFRHTSHFYSLKLQTIPISLPLHLPFTLLGILFPIILTWLTSTGFQKAFKRVATPTGCHKTLHFPSNMRFHL